MTFQCDSKDENKVGYKEIEFGEVVYRGDLTYEIILETSIRLYSEDGSVYVKKYAYIDNALYLFEPHCPLRLKLEPAK